MSRKELFFYLHPVEVREVLAARRQVVVLERGQYLLELQEEAFAWGILVGVHVEGERRR